MLSRPSSLQKRSPEHSFVLVLAFILCALLVQSCGFYLRTDNLGTYIDSVSLKVLQAPQMRRDLVIALDKNDVEITEGESYDVLIEVIDHEYSKNTSLVVPRRGLVEFELTLRVGVRLELQDSAEEVNLTLEQTGRVRVNFDKLLSTSAEEEKVRVELNTRIVKAIIDSLYLRLRERL